MSENQTPTAVAEDRPEDVRAVLEKSLSKLRPHRVVAIPAGSLRAVGIKVDSQISDKRPVEFKVSELRKALAKK